MNTLPRRVWLSYYDGRWRVVDITYYSARQAGAFGVALFNMWINQRFDDPRHFQIGCVITPRAIIGV